MTATPLPYTRTPAPAVWTNTRDSLDMTDEQQLSGTAHHEAGHAIAYTHHGLVIGPITFHGTDGQGPGRASLHLPQPSGPWEGYAIGAAAGHLAEIEWMRRAGLLTPTRKWVAEMHSAGDQTRADEVIRQCLGEPLTFGQSLGQADWLWLCGRADEIVVTQWERVARVASVLVDAWSSGQMSVSPEALEVGL